MPKVKTIFSLLFISAVIIPASITLVAIIPHLLRKGKPVYELDLRKALQSSLTIALTRDLKKGRPLTFRLVEAILWL